MAAISILEVGELGVCCYVVYDEQAIGPDKETPPCVVIDPGDDVDNISARLERLGLKLEMVLLTHSHVDHIGAVDALLAAWPGSILACSEETSRRLGDPRLNLSVFLGPPIVCQPANRFLKDGESFVAAGLTWCALEVPGHDPGEMVYILNDNEALFSGDTIFERSIGRSDFPGGDGPALIRGVVKLLSSLPPETPIYPGHGPATDVGSELKLNPFLQHFMER